MIWNFTILYSYIISLRIFSDELYLPYVCYLFKYEHLFCNFPYPILQYYNLKCIYILWYLIFLQNKWYVNVCKTLQWHHNGHDSISNHQPHDCLLNRLFGRRLKKTSKLHVTGLCAGNSPGTSELPTQMASNAENVSIWWRHRVWHFLFKSCVFQQAVLQDITKLNYYKRNN